MTPIIKKVPDSKNNLAPFQFHGLEFHQNGSSQATSDCPFCGKSNHFYCNVSTGQWDCKSCGEKGNIYTFLKKLLQENEATPKQKQYLAQFRKLPKSAFDDFPLGKSSDGRFLLPVFSPEKPNSLVGLRVFDPDTKKLLSTSGLSLHLLNGNNFLENNGSDFVYVCEGDWDTMALEWLRRTVKKDGIVVGVPGAQTFKQQWIPLFEGKEVFFCYDADDPGQQGQQKSAELLLPVAKSVRTIIWPASVPKGYDINDFISERLKSPKSAWEELHGMFHAVTSKTHKSVQKEDQSEEEVVQKKVWDKIPTFPELLKEFSKSIHLDKDMKDALAVTLASAISIKIPGDPVWMFIVGPPGAGKTLILRAMADSDLCQFESNLRPHALVSGMRTEDGEDSSLIPKLKDRALVLKDYTEIRSQDRTNQEAIYGILRGAYDGHVRYTFGNGLIRDYPDNYFSMVAGVTHEIHGDNRASLGERFLKCEFLGDSHNPEQHIRAAIDGMDTLTANELKLRDKVAAFLSREITPSCIPKTPEWVKARIIALSQIVGHLRASVNYLNKTELHFRPRPEIGTRLAKQLIKLALSLAVIQNQKTITDECYRLVEKVAFDTATGFNLDIIQAIMSRYPRPVSIMDLCRLTRLTPPTVNRKLQSLLELGNAVRSRVAKPQAGQPEYGYIVSPGLVKLWKAAKIGQKSH